MTKEQILEAYEGRLLTDEDLSHYEKWATSFFHQKDKVQEPILQMTLQVDVTEGYKHYEATHKQNPDASFYAYLCWNIIKTQEKHPYFRFRKIEDKWYIFENLPLFIPVAIGGASRFDQVVMDNPTRTPLAEFFGSFRSKVKEAFTEGHFTELPELLWAHSHFIGNLPNLKFTGFQIHTPADKSGRPFFYFGKRYQQEGRQYIPLLIAFDHSNLDPFVISAFMEDLDQNLISS